jgi:hypothetical protein
MTEPIEVRVPMMPGIMSDHEMQQTIVDKLLAAGVPVVSTMQGATVTKGILHKSTNPMNFEMVFRWEP